LFCPENLVWVNAVIELRMNSNPRIMKATSFVSRVAVVLTCLTCAAVKVRAGATLNTIYHFNDFNGGVVTPAGGLVLSGNWIYGMGYGFGSNNGGVFKVQTDGKGFFVLKAFNWSNPKVQAGDGPGGDGYPGTGYGGLVLSPDGSVLYGLYPADGFGGGAVFRVNTDGTQFAFIHSFAGLLIGGDYDGASPSGGLALSPDGSVLYGTTLFGGSNGNGTIFSLNTNGGNYAVLYNFSALNSGANSNGSNPTGVVISPDGTTLYGTTYQGGSFVLGVFYAFTLSSNQLAVLHYFQYPGDLGEPVGTPLLSGGMLYGVQSGYGTGVDQSMVFAINTNGTFYEILQTFGSGFDANAFPVGLLALTGNTLYGTSTYGVPGQGNGLGNVFEVNIDGTGYADLNEFSGSDTNGVLPLTGLVASGRNLYGTTSAGGDFGGGTLFQLTPQAVLSLTVNAGTAFLHWADGLSEYNLQSSADAPTVTAYSNVPAFYYEPIDQPGFYRAASNTMTNMKTFFRLVSRPKPPTVITAPASALLTNGVTLNGSVLPNGADATYWFEYGLDTNYNGGTTASNIISASNSIAVQITNPITGLTSGTIYHFQLVATNIAGTNVGGDLTFTTATLASPPTAVTLSASAVSSGSAQLNGTVNPNGGDTTWWFEYGYDTNYSIANTASAVVSAANTNAVAVNILAGGLNPLTLYHYQLVTSNSAGVSYGGDQQFTTQGPPPTLVTLAASSITTTSAVLNGTVNGNGTAIAGYFQYGTDTSYGSDTSGNQFSSSNANYYATAEYSTAISGLTPNTTYHYRILAFNGSSEGFGADTNFTTATVVQPSPPTAQTTAATNVRLISGYTYTAQFNGTVNPNGVDTQVYFQYGVSQGSLSSTTPMYDIGSGTTPTSYNFTVNTLNQQTSSTYYFQIVASNSIAVTNGGILSFTLQ
jgi:uncharacterized repeat protein (TIGR03803 family)